MSNFREFIGATIIFDILVAGTADGLLELTVRTFDGRLGRISESGRPIPDGALKNKPEVYDAIYVGD